jgi:hypothetical protein
MIVNTRSLHNILIVMHAASGVISFIAGSLLLIPRERIGKPWVFRVYLAFLVGLVVFLAGAMLVYWVEYAVIERALYSGLLLLSLFMLFRAQKTRAMGRPAQSTREHDDVEHIGFTLISLFEGFVIVAIINAGGPGWLVGLLAILGIVLGRWLIGIAKQRIEPV